MKNLFFIILLLVLWSCKNQIVPGAKDDPALKTTKDLIISSNFNFATSNEVSIGILVKNASENLAGVPVSIYLDYPGTTEQPILNARKIGTFTSQADGRIDVKFKLPQAQDSLYLKTNYIGLESEAGFKISGSSASYIYGEGNSLKSAPLSLQTKAGIIYTYPGQFNDLGAPTNYLIHPVDRIPKGLLDTINIALPEGKSLPATHPEYFVPGNRSDIVITSQTDLWITFISEGTNKQNALGFYAYDVANPPKSIGDIPTFTILFPNTSLKGSGGGLLSGDKVKLGTFGVGKAIGWFLVPGGWSGKVQTGVTGSPTYFSDPALNPETNLTKKPHIILLNNQLRGQVILGIEDLNRETGSSDEDFNDVLFNITATSIASINTKSNPSIVPPPPAAPDLDNDGVINTFDEFPLDPLRAYTNYYPAKDQYNSLLVEDLWPSLGDFDFNDLVLDCQYKNVTNAKSEIVELFIRLKVRAIGATFRNGFGIQLPVATSAVSSVTITDQAGIVKKTSVEDGQLQAVVIAFNDAFTLLPSTGGGIGVNVIPGAGLREPKDIELHVLFATPQTATSIGTAPYNPFVFVNGDRTKEIHLADSKPTSKANAAFFGQGDDSSNPASSRYYKSKNNLVWMIEVPSSYKYNIETKEILKADLKFGPWAESGGAQYKDWYMDKPGYHDNSLKY